MILGAFFRILSTRSLNMTPQWFQPSDVLGQITTCSYYYSQFGPTLPVQVVDVRSPGQVPVNLYSCQVVDTVLFLQTCISHFHCLPYMIPNFFGEQLPSVITILFCCGCQPFQFVSELIFLELLALGIFFSTNSSQYSPAIFSFFLAVVASPFSWCFSCRFSS